MQRSMAVVLVSGGMDSCVTAAFAAQDYDLAFLHINYGQRTEKKELEALPQLIETLEAEQQQLHDGMADPDFYKKGADVAAAAGRLEELKEQLENAYARWQTLEELHS